MVLAQCQLAEQIKTEQYPPFLARIQTAASEPIPVEIDWVSFSSYDNYGSQLIIEFLGERL